MKFLITNDASFISSGLAKKLLNEGNESVPLAPPPTGSEDNAARLKDCKGFEPCIASIPDQSLVLELVEQ